MSWPGGRAVSPAKLNLFLSVGPPGSDGFHPVETLLQAVSLADEVEAEPASQDSVEFDPPVVQGPNTVERALRLARGVADFPTLRVCVRKRIPVQSGLGGGSSNAAAVLRLAALASEGALPAHSLPGIARQVGSDVPFFLVGGLGHGTGYGDHVRPLPDLPTAWLVVAMPDVGVSSKEAYAALDSLPRRLRPVPEDPWSLSNDFEAVAPASSVGLIAWMRDSGALRAGLTGSGAAVFGRFGSELEAQECARSCPAKAWPVRTLGREESLWTS